jgi:hypothetical protein
MVEARNAQASSVRGNGHWIGVMVQHILTYSVVCDSSKVVSKCSDVDRKRRGKTARRTSDKAECNCCRGVMGNLYTCLYCLSGSQTCSKWRRIARV